MGSLIYYVVGCFKIIPWLLSGQIPRRSGFVLYGSWFGRKAGDNAFKLFLSARSQGLKNHYFVTADKSKLHFPGVIFIYSFRSILIHLRSKYIFVSSGKGDVLSYLCRNATFINLWHGSPIKSILKTDQYTYKKGWENWKKRLMPFLSEYNYSFVLSEGEFFDKILCESFDINYENLLKTGSPRNVGLLESNISPSESRRRIERDFPGCRVIGFMPTFRKSYSADYFNTFDDKVNSKLDKENLVIVAKLHLAELGDLDIPYKRIVDFEEYFHGIDTNDFLAQCDALISDYSSVIFDYMLTSKPISLFVFDLAKYETYERKLLFDLELIDVPLLKNWDEVIRDLIDRIGLVVKYGSTFSNYLSKDCCNNIFDKLKIERS